MNNTRKLLITTTISIALITIISVAAACGPGGCGGGGGGGGFSTVGVAITFIGGLIGGVLGVLIANKMNK